MLKVGKTALITTSAWFIAPDGQQYRAVFGTIQGIRTDSEVLGIQTNRHSANWYVEIGNMTIAGCQINYAVECDSVHQGEVLEWSVEKDKCYSVLRPSTMYMADNQAE